MGDAGEGLVDAAARIQERMEELEREKQIKGSGTRPDSELKRTLDSLEMALAGLNAQLSATTSAMRKTQLSLAIEEVSRRIEEARSRTV